MIEVLHFLLVSLCHLFNRTEPWRDSWLQGLFDFAVWGNGNTVQQGDLQKKKGIVFYQKCYERGTVMDLIFSLFCLLPI